MHVLRQNRLSGSQTQFGSKNMSKAIYSDFTDLNGQQEKVMKFIVEWVRNKKTTVPQKEIVSAMAKQGIKIDSVKFALKNLLAKGYIRRSLHPEKNRVEYVQLRNL